MIDDELVNKVTWRIPNALALVGSASGGTRNAMTTSWITQLNTEPVLIGIGVDNDAADASPHYRELVVLGQPVALRRHECS